MGKGIFGSRKTKLMPLCGRRQCHPLRLRGWGGQGREKPSVRCQTVLRAPCNFRWVRRTRYTQQHCRQAKSLDTPERQSPAGALPYLHHEPAGRAYRNPWAEPWADPALSQSWASPCGIPSRDTDHQTKRMITFKERARRSRM